MTIASVLVKNGARMDYIPPEELSRASPFVSTPAQSPIGEAARCGYSRIVQVWNPTYSCLISSLSRYLGSFRQRCS
jgi:hypothetical protein